MTQPVPLLCCLPLVLLLAACSDAPPPPAAAAPVSNLTPSPGCQPPADARLQSACDLLAAGDATGARLALREITDARATPRALRREAQRLLDVDLALLQAGQQIARDEIFLTPGLLDAAARKAGNSAMAQERIAQLRARLAEVQVRLRGEAALLASATAHLLETAKLLQGDYPLHEEEARALVEPALAQAGGKFTLTGWKPTLRGYELLLQDTRSGESVLVVPDDAAARP
jgi:hypothetical protein